MKYESFGELRMAAAEAFVRTAILIDNEPEQEASSASDQQLVAKSAAFEAAPAGGEAADPASVDLSEPATAGEEAVADVVSADPTLPVTAAGDLAADAGSAGATVPADIVAGHKLPVRPVTNAFAERKITCGFYFPADDEDNVVPTALAAARHVDVTIVDWHLRPGDVGPAQQIIAELIKDDEAAGGRLRLVVIYTGERGLDAECAKLQEHLTTAGITNFQVADDGRALKSPHARITFANKPQSVKPELEMAGPGARPVDWGALPKFILEEYAHLAEGLLQSFALKSIGAIREDTHHLLSVFSPELDGAYLAQRAGISAPSDAEEMMVALLTSEFATSINDRGIPEDTLGADAAIHALKIRDDPQEIKVKEYKSEPVYKAIVQTPAGGGKHIVADKASLESLCRTGLDHSIVRLSDEARRLLDQQFFANEEDALRVLSRFARLASFSREANQGRRLDCDALILTGGVVVRSISVAGDQTPQAYLLCVQPGCDAVRLTGKVAFPFCGLTENSNSFDLIVAADGAEKRFKVERKPSSLRMLDFNADGDRQVVISTEEGGKRGFRAVDGVFWEFLAELRPLEAQHFTSLLVGKFNRVALNGSEWLRLHGARDQ